MALAQVKFGMIDDMNGSPEDGQEPNDEHEQDQGFHNLPEAQQRPPQQDMGQALATLRQKWANELQMIQDMGLVRNEAEVLQLLEAFGGNVEAVINQLLGDM